MTEHWNAGNRKLLAAVLVAAAFLTAQHHAYALIAVPQGNEWQLIVEGAKHVRLNSSGAAAHFRDRLDPRRHLHRDDLSRRVRLAVVEFRMGAEGDVQARHA